ncbi:DUF3888 domain-containing protein [Paenibacillus sp. DMB20]|uniref:DUF3888 domain-containing protein n=1 Tax=Paenibacillus sp. DMB20 TaxID=1642570 RepID=UPI00062784D9|nr:DUF3888 domain-containing protein [Paenibacillus sp. DMB20]KKO53473.1 hypothetical protein XI25_12830 [Paenibacillus sp. DMB20]
MYKLILFLVLFASSIPAHKSLATPKTSEISVNKEVILTLLSPTINNEVQNYYKKYLTVPVSLPPYAMKIIEINKPDTTNQYKFQLVIELNPYVGPHLGVGQDILTLTIDLDGITVDELKHIKDEELPPHWKHIKKEN